MTDDQTEAVAHRWHLEMVQEGKLELAEQTLTPDVTIHANQQVFQGRDAAKQLAAGLKTAFPDIQIAHLETLVSGDSAAVRWTSDGSHQGDYFGVPPTGKRIHVEGMDLFHVRDGKIVEMWIEYDNLAVLQQMGAIPEAQPAGA
jgi:steroid delta-isomerase-like uncharacterized protein